MQPGSIDRVFQNLARAKLRDLRRLDLDRGAGLGITPTARSPLADDEGSEAHQRDAPALFQRGTNRAHRRLERSTRRRFGDVGLLGDVLDQIGLVQGSPLGK